MRYMRFAMLENKVHRLDVLVAMTNVSQESKIMNMQKVVYEERYYSNVDD